ncbi:MAG: hypothetical protein RMJ55_04905 [Roseiflexaceae bacterium]|nr:hypothetical protein [Roseiflexus sp.]MDW8146676.1 hypothetical protein [Roseiflexaceae bacterium]MDW8212873.1 hypothetical protein [Roseiflexaceae bacterium]
MPGETPVDWITLLQIALALGILSLCCWLIGVTAAARIQARRQRRSISQNAPDRQSAPSRTPGGMQRSRPKATEDIS